jgi:hypothetical protein
MEPDEAAVTEIVAQYRERHGNYTVQPASRFGRTLAFWVPSRFVSSSEINVDAMLTELDDIVSARGMVLYDRQIVTVSLRDNAADISSYFEPRSSDFEMPDRCEWSEPQQTYFHLDNPYQMIEESDRFTWSHLAITLNETPLGMDENIVGILHGVEDKHYLYCPCQFATIVYTTKKRLICMSCTATHAVLAEPLPISSGQEISADDWADFFDNNGSRRHEEVDLATIDFREVESATLIWSTDQWEAAVREFIFFARSQPAEIQAAIQGTEADASVLLEAGFTSVPQSPPPAFHLRPDSYDVDILDNATQAVRDGVRDLHLSYNNPDALGNALLNLFRCIELILKARLELIDERALEGNPNNPTVLNQLRSGGVSIDSDELAVIVRLRRLRNRLQHGSAQFSLRSGLTIGRGAIVFIDRFVVDELGLWLGDAISGDDWWKLLTIPEIASNADTIVSERIQPMLRSSREAISSCPRCSRDTLCRPHPSTGASCAYCGFIPTAEHG